MGSDLWTWAGADPNRTLVGWGSSVILDPGCQAVTSEQVYEGHDLGISAGASVSPGGHWIRKGVCGSDWGFVIRVRPTIFVKGSVVLSQSPYNWGGGKN